MTLPLFDAPSETFTPEVKAKPSDAPVEMCEKSHNRAIPTGPDVIRVIASRHGTFTRASGDGVTGEFYLVQLRGGRVVQQYLDGTRTPSTVTAALIESSLASGQWREVAP